MKLSDFFIMRKSILIITAVTMLTAGPIAAYHYLVAHNAEDDPIRQENAIIIHGIKMTSDKPPSETEDDAEGQIIYDDAFDDAIIDYDKMQKRKSGTSAVKNVSSDFEKMRLKDRRWHLRRYRIKKNDNLWKIAKRYGVHQHLIISQNKINNPDMLKPGRYINVPTRMGVYYQVRKGDTITRIAGRHKIPAQSIVAHNRLRGNIIRPGQKLFLPDAIERHEVTRVAVKKKRASQTMVAGVRNFRWPLRGRITSGFGNRTDPLYGQRQFHCGIDISANVGTPIRSAASGKVIFSGWKSGYGKCVILRHDNGFITVYAHNSRNVVAVDGTVRQGEIIAYSGMTGAVTGAHLHFEIRKYVNPLNPLRFLR